MFVKSVSALVVLAAVASSALAGMVTATFDTVNPGQVVTIQSKALSSNPVTESGWAGVYNFKNATGDLTGSFKAFCIDIAQDIFGNQTVQFGVAALSNAPTPGTAMGQYRADLLAELWSNHYADLGTSSAKAASFQLDIWEVINETQLDANNHLVLNLGAGDFRVSSGDPGYGQAWLNELDLTGNGSKTTNLIALTNPTFQDYVTLGNPVPAPSSLLLGGLGTASLLLGAAWRRAGRLLPAVG